MNFIELANEAGIRMTADNGADVTKLGSEVFYLSSPFVPSGYPVDATVNQIGTSTSGFEALINILESPGGPLSDQVWLHHINSVFTVIDFISDPAQFVTSVAPFATVVETGSLQNVLNYTNDQGGNVSIYVQSDIPEPATALLFPIALAGLLANSRRQMKKAASV